MTVPGLYGPLSSVRSLYFDKFGNFTQIIVNKLDWDKLYKGKKKKLQVISKGDIKVIQNHVVFECLPDRLYVFHFPAQ